MSCNSYLENKEVLIKVENVSKSFHLYAKPADRLLQFIAPSSSSRFKEFKALEDISFDLRQGEVIGIIGANGAGKSTLLQLVTGTINPSTGKITTKGRVAAILELGSGFNPEFTGLENIFLNAATLGLDKNEIENRLDSIIEFAGIGDHLSQPVKTYSSGMIVRLAFSIATSVDPDILIIDEALSVGDGAFRRRSFDRIMQIKEKGTTILFCSHVLYHIETFCDKALWLHKGQLKKFGKVSDVLEPYQNFIDAYESNVNIDPSIFINKKESDPESIKAHLDHNSYPSSDARIDKISISIDGKTGDNQQCVALNSSLEIIINFSSDPNLAPPTAAFVISNENGKILGSSLSLTNKVIFNRSDSGEGIAQFFLEKIPLNKGKYRLGVYLFCERGLHGYAMLDPAANLEVTHHGNESGPYLFNGQWK